MNNTQRHEQLLRRMVWLAQKLEHRDVGGMHMTLLSDALEAEADAVKAMLESPTSERAEVERDAMSQTDRAWKDLVDFGDL